MYRHKHKFVDELKRFDIDWYVDAFIVGIRRMEGRVFNLRNLNEVEYMIELINTPRYTTFKSTKGPHGFYYWDSQRVDFVRSN